jgi:uncharacterized protein DUF5681
VKAKKPHSEDAAPELTSSTKRHGDYAVGKWRPPVKSQFPKGVSGNPKGRPKGRRSLRASLEAILNQKITVRDGTKVRSISKVDALLLKMVNAGLQGDHNTALKTLALARWVEVDAAKETDRSKAEFAKLTDEEVLQVVIERNLTVKMMTMEQLHATANSLEAQLKAAGK